MARAEKKYTVLAEALFSLLKEAKNEKDEHAIAEAFARYCVKNSCAWLLPKIEKEVLALERKEKGIIDAEIVSAVPLGDKERKAVVAQIAALVKKDVEQIDARFVEHTKIGGGLLVKAGEYMIDGTVAAAIQKLKKQLTA